MDIVTRAQWGARQPTGAIAMTTWGRRIGVAVHHSAGPTTQTVRSIQDYQMNVRGWPDIGYNWLVDQQGRLYEGRQGTWLAVGAHSAGENVSHIGVCWLGHSGQVAPTPQALATIRWVYDEACRRTGRTLAYSGHGQLPGEATECPGSRLRAWIAAGMPTTGEDDDMSAAEVWNLPLAEVPAETLDTGERVPASKDPVPAYVMLGYALRHAYAARRAAEELLERPAVQPAPVDPATLKATLLDPEVLAAIAKAVVDEDHRRSAA